MYVKKGLTACEGNCNKGVVTDAYFCLGVVYNSQIKLDSAEYYFLKSYKLAKQSEDVRLLLDNIDYLTQLYIQTNRTFLAKQYLQEGEELIDQGEQLNLELIKIFFRFTQLYKKLGDFESQATYSRSIFNSRIAFIARR
jgi:hypothetical protein